MRVLGLDLVADIIWHEHSCSHRCSNNNSQLIPNLHHFTIADQFHEAQYQVKRSE